jgi:hypothetical protein
LSRPEGSGPAVAVFGSARLGPGDPELDEARLLGRLLADGGWTVLTGGYDGAMAAVSEGAHAVGGHVVGVTMGPWSPRRSPNPWVREERRAESLHARLGQLVAAQAWVAVAGGIGTLSEVALAWNMLQTGEVEARPLVLVGHRWPPLLRAIGDLLVVDDRDLELVRTVPDAAAALRELGAGGDAG